MIVINMIVLCSNKKIENQWKFDEYCYTNMQYPHEYYINKKLSICNL